MMIEIDRRKILVFDIEVAAHDFETFLLFRLMIGAIGASCPAK